MLINFKEHYIIVMIFSSKLRQKWQPIIFQYTNMWKLMKKSKIPHICEGKIGECLPFYLFYLQFAQSGGKYILKRPLTHFYLMKAWIANDWTAEWNTGNNYNLEEYELFSSLSTKSSFNSYELPEVGCQWHASNLVLKHLFSFLGSVLWKHWLEWIVPILVFVTFY